MKRFVTMRDPAAERIVVEQRPGNSLALRIDWSRGDSSTLRLSYAEANRVAEFIQEVAGLRIGNQDEVEELGGSGGGDADRPKTLDDADGSRPV